MQNLIATTFEVVHYIALQAVHYKPLQEVHLSRYNHFGIITLDVYPNDELYSKLLSWGKAIEVVSPANVRDEMKMIVDAIVHYYH